MRVSECVLCSVLGFFLFVSQTGAAPGDYIVADDDFYPRDAAKEELGRFLMFDKILSGNKNISCATCHHPFTATGDGLSLSVGEGGAGLGATRGTGIEPHAIKKRAPRNAPPLFNLGAKEYTVMFADGRVAVDASQPSGFFSPAGDDLPHGLDNVLAAQAMFPVASPTEMAGQAGENAIADAAAAERLAGAGGVWDLLAQRLREIDEYVELFTAAFADIDSAGDITFTHAANAIAAFESAAFRCTNSRFDQFVRYGFADWEVLSTRETRGGVVFMAAGCADCHSGTFQTDHAFHAIGLPQIGPGKGDSLPGYTDGRDDFGRERVTGDIADRFKFRTPSLRQVALTGPWGHSGAYSSLEAMVRHHLNAVQALHDYDISQTILPSRDDLDALDFIVQNDVLRRQAIAAAVEITPVALHDAQIDDLMVFLEETLTDYDCLRLDRHIPPRVPSGLPVFD